MEKTTRNISKNHALPVGSQGDSEIYGAKKNLLGSSGERNEDNAACRYIADGLAGRYDSRLCHSKEAAKLLRGMYLSM